MFASRVSGLLTKTGLFKMAFVRVLGITAGLELRTRNNFTTMFLTAAREWQAGRWVKNVSGDGGSWL